MKLLFAAVLAAIASMLVPGSVFAQSNDVILQRLDALEKENAALRDRMRRIESQKQATASVKANAKPDSVPSTMHATTAYASAAPVYKATSPAASALGTWTGFYIGAHGGYAGGKLLPPCCNGGGGQGGNAPGDNGQGNNGQGNNGQGGNGGATSNIGFANVGLTGGFGGVQVGYNYQFAPHWLFGVEQDISFGNISGSQSEPAPNPTIGVATTYSGTIRERFGYIIGDRALLYETAGVAWAVNKASLQFQDPTQGQSLSETHWQYGVALGAGMEWAIDSNLSIKVEYLYSYLTKEQYFSGTGNAGLAGWPLSTVRAGANWRFN
jgi:outer membrane immunogenic protein